MDKNRICPLSEERKTECTQTDSCNNCPFYLDKTCSGCWVNLRETKKK